MYDVVIVGGSFAGLAVAMQLRGYRVLLLDQHPIGARQMSACGTPLATARALSAVARSSRTSASVRASIATQNAR